MIFSELRLIIDGPGTGSWNMAVDEALLRLASIPTLRVYDWDEPSVTFGYFERVTEIRKLRPNLPLTRRWTGGGLVDHGSDWTYSLIIPAGHAWSKESRRESYRVIHQAIRALLEQAGVGGIEIARTDSGVAEGCFVHPVPGDLLLGGEKIAGAAQRRTRDGLLHQGSVQKIQRDLLQADHLAAALGSRVVNPGLDDAERVLALRLQSSRYDCIGWLERC